jgi:NADPH-dependent 2,4-dienoyl-CoA reductase/sulfur reductase-like enzyme/nitrite reductase/ring-hydroxylating ferredoxin subunit
MSGVRVLKEADLPLGSKKAIKIGETEILLVHLPGSKGVEPTIAAVEAKCPHAGAPLEQGALCDGKLVCPWHAATYSLPAGTWLEPPTMRSLKTYSVRVEDGSIFVDPEPRTSPTIAGDSYTQPLAGDIRHFVLLGAGAASATAVCTLRQRGFAGKITVVDPMPEEPVDRTNLSKMALSGDKKLDALPLWKPEERASLAIERITGEASLLDVEEKQIKLATGEVLHYDAALIATGGEPARLGIPGEDMAHVHTLRHVVDLEAILKDAPEGARAVIIGDSFIAFETASALCKRGLAVTLVCRSKAPFTEKWGEAAADALLAMHVSHGIKVELEAEAASIQSAAVLLKNGRELAADVVLVAIGIHPRTQFAGQLPGDDKQRIRVGFDLRCAPAVWAAGDVTAVESPSGSTHIEHWRVAQQHGRVAALSMLGETETLGVPFFWTYHFGKRIAYAGHAESWDEMVVDGDLSAFKFLIYYLKGDKVAAVLGCGEDTAIAALEHRLRAPLTLEEARAAAGASD